MTPNEREKFPEAMASLTAKEKAAAPALTKATQAPGYFEAYYHLGLSEATLGRNNEAQTAFQTSIDLSGGRYAVAEFGYGYLLCQEGKPSEAEIIIRRGLEVEHAEAEGYAVLSEALMRLTQLDEAEKSAREALLRNAG